MQLMPQTAQAMGFTGNARDLYDPEINLFGTNAGGIGSVQTTAADRGFDFGGYPIPRSFSISARFSY